MRIICKSNYVLLITAPTLRAGRCVGSDRCPLLTQSGLRGDAAGARVGIEDHNDYEGNCTPLHRFATAFLGKSSGEDQVLLKIYCRKNVAKIDRIKLFARKYLIQRLYISRKSRI